MMTTDMNALAGLPAATLLAPKGGTDTVVPGAAPFTLSIEVSVGEVEVDAEGATTPDWDGGGIASEEGVPRRTAMPWSANPLRTDGIALPIPEVPVSPQEATGPLLIPDPATPVSIDPLTLAATAKPSLPEVPFFPAARLTDDSTVSVQTGLSEAITKGAAPSPTDGIGRDAPRSPDAPLTRGRGAAEVPASGALLPWSEGADILFETRPGAAKIAARPEPDARPGTFVSDVARSIWPEGGFPATPPGWQVRDVARFGPETLPQSVPDKASEALQQAKPEAVSARLVTAVGAATSAKIDDPSAAPAPAPARLPEAPPLPEDRQDALPREGTPKPALERPQVASAPVPNLEGPQRAEAPKPSEPGPAVVPADRATSPTFLPSVQRGTPPPSPSSEPVVQEPTSRIKNDEARADIAGPRDYRPIRSDPKSAPIVPTSGGALVTAPQSTPSVDTSLLQPSAPGDVSTELPGLPRAEVEPGGVRLDPARLPVEQATRGLDMARAVQSQLVEITRQRPGGAIEVRLSPEELGGVRMTVAQAENDVTISVLVERAETLDLIRRHADILSTELRNAGFERLTFSFGQGNGGDAPERQPSSPSGTSAQDTDTPPETANERAAERPLSGDAARLDIRV